MSLYTEDFFLLLRVLIRAREALLLLFVECCRSRRRNMKVSKHFFAVVVESAIFLDNNFSTRCCVCVFVCEITPKITFDGNSHDDYLRCFFLGERDP